MLVLGQVLSTSNLSESVGFDQQTYQLRYIKFFFLNHMKKQGLTKNGNPILEDLWTRFESLCIWHGLPEEGC